MHATKSPIILSVIIATYNRSRLINEALFSLSNQKNLDTGGALVDGFEVLVIDNLSSDDTKEVVSGWKQYMPNLRYFFETRQGVSYARNRGIVEARGEYLVFLDDECTVDKGYIWNLSRLVMEVRPILFGGIVLPRYRQHPGKPVWFLDKYGTFSDFQENVDPNLVWLSGANMGGLRECLVDVGGFSTKLGPSGEVMVYGEENELTERMKRKYGSSCVHYFRSVLAYHLVRPEKYSIRAYLKEQCLRGYWVGQLSYNTSPSDNVGIAGLVNMERAGLVIDLLKSPFFRDKDRYPYVQNYIIEVIVPFIRTLFILIGRMRRKLSKE